MPHGRHHVRETRNFRFRSRPEAVAAARRALDGFEQQLDLSVFYDASLCVSELVTNAVLHADMREDEELELDVEVSDSSLVVTVTDLGGGFEPGPLSPGDESGFGLYIVDRLSDRWGVERGERTRVWFEMALRAEQDEEDDARPGAAAEGGAAPAQGEGRLSPRRAFVSARLAGRFGH
jgi:anti-sigma regulatory factor (Ser/Thr protein kinase)